MGDPRTTKVSSLTRVTSVKSANPERLTDSLREDIKTIKTFQYGHCPNFFDTFFDQLIVPKKVIFYPKLTIFVGFFSNFCHHYQQNYQNFDQNYHGNDYYQCPN